MKHPPSVRKQISTTLAVVLVGNLLAQLAAAGVLALLGYEPSVLREEIDQLPAATLAGMLGINQTLSYLLPGIVAAALLYGGDWLRAVGLRPLPPLRQIMLALAIFFGTLWLTGVLAQLNANVELPAWQQEIEQQVAGILGSILRSTSTGGFLLALLIVGLLPALGEELVFRGLLQPAIVKLTPHPHLGIWITACLFGLVHLQFAGLLPRIFLGAVLGFLAYYGKNLWLPILAHLVFNGSQVAAVRYADLAVESPASAASEQLGPSAVAAALAVAVLALWIGLPGLKPERFAGPAVRGSDDRPGEPPA